MSDPVFLFGNLLAVILALMAFVWVRVRTREGIRALVAAAVVWGAVLFAGQPLIRHWVEAPQRAARQVQAQAEQALLQRPEFRALKQYEPDRYHDLLQQLTLRPAKPLDAAARNRIMRAEMVEAIAASLPRASDDAIAAYVDSVIGELDVLEQEQDGSLCMTYLYPLRGEGIDAPKYFPAELLDAESSAIAAVIRSAHVTPRNPPDPRQAMEAFAPVASQIADEFGRDWQAVLLYHDRPETDKAKVCRIVARVYQLTRRLPPQVRSPAQRYWARPHA